MLGHRIAVGVLVLNRARKGATLGETELKVVGDVGDEDAKDGGLFLADHAIEQLPVLGRHAAADAVLEARAATARLVTGLAGVELRFGGAAARIGYQVCGSTAAVDANGSTRADVAAVIGNQVLALNGVAALDATNT